jgi:hypothetical protein
LSIAFGKLYIADTNNHSIRVADLKSRKVATIQFKNLEKLRPFKTLQAQFSGEIITLPAQVIAPGEALLTLQLELPEGCKLNPLAPSVINLTSSDEQIIRLKQPQQQHFGNGIRPLAVPLQVREGEAYLNINLLVYYCQSAIESLCYFKEAQLNVPVKVAQGAGTNSLTASYKVTL